MHIFLVRHGNALEKYEDRLRPLSPHGQEEIKELADKIKKLSVIPQQIYHSGVLRAKESATIIKESLALTQDITEVKDLLPESNPNKWADKIESEDKDTMLVGHLPFMGLLQAILCPDSYPDFPTSKAICLKLTDGRWNIIWESTLSAQTI